uniref:Uncharacterized protein n=1 Tax=Timema bartmani TaxID=61472 RepID=A0A7R9F0S8_9NEOP|nr:unnamed protein product [Timema bartmani]
MQVLSLAAPQHPKNATKPIITPTTISSVAVRVGTFLSTLNPKLLPPLPIIVYINSGGILEALRVLQN